MKVAVVGTGYVGLVAGVCFADSGHDVICVDFKEKIDLLNAGLIPIYEPGLEDVLKTAKARIEFSTNLVRAVQHSQVIFIAVGTPEKSDGSADLGPTMAVVRDIAKATASIHTQTHVPATEKAGASTDKNSDKIANKKFDGTKILVLKSTVPVGTAREVRAIINDLAPDMIEVVSNPEFLKEGAAIDDFLKPDRVVIGLRDGDANSETAQAMRDLYDPFLKNGNPILFMENTAAELTKYAANAFLSVKISFINELALLADKVGCDINDVRKGFTSDRRINPAFFHPGVGYGGSCFPKDVKALIYTGEKHEVPMALVKAADDINDRQKHVLFGKIKQYFAKTGSALSGKTIAVWGLAFKPRTDDVREAPALELIEQLVLAGVKVQAYDPIAMATATIASRQPFVASASAEAALMGADALVIVTEWNEFRSPDLNDIKRQLRSPVIFDGRNILDPAKVSAAGFDYYCIGRESVARTHAPDGIK
jgi:UDPglucose 6-dehydrogenase